VDPVALAEGAASRARKSRNPVYVRPGEYTVILEPSAVLDLVCFLYDDFTGTEHWYETSSFLKKIGKSVLGDNITITDDANHPLQTGFLFDDEGMNRKTVTIVKDGVLKTPVKSRRSVKYLGGSPTGHGAAPSAAEGEFPMNIVVAGGDSSLEEMIASTKRGILLTRVWYVRDVDPNTKLLTGMTRDGTFLVENGKVTRGIKNLRFNQSVIDMLKNVVEIGQPVLAAGEETFPAVVPPMKIEGFKFSSRTKA
jgi:predicted Zn-dependent protease